MAAVPGLGPLGRAGAAVVALVSLASLLLQYVVLVRSTLDTIGPVLATVRYASYFTILGNLLVTAVATIAAFDGAGRVGAFLARPRTRACAALYIGVTGIIYVVILRHLWQPQGVQWWADAGLHYATPVLYLAWWLACVPHGGLRWGDVPRWLLFPLVYVLWSLARGAVVHEYPYPFIDVGQLGLAVVLRNAAGILVLLLALGALLVAADRALGRRPAVASA